MTEYKKWETKPTTDRPTENTTCVGVAMALVDDEPQREYDKGLQLFADILFDKKKSEQFLKECKAIGIEPEAKKEDE